MSQDPRLIPPEEPTPSDMLDYAGETDGAMDDIMLGTNAKVSLERLGQWSIDWEGYMEKFSAAHGGKPVQIDEWLVWEDGWSCDAYDIGGTERQPPTEKEKLDALLRVYYGRRREVQLGFFYAIQNQVEYVRSVQRHKSMPLIMRSVSWLRKMEGGVEVFLPQLHEGEVDLTGALSAMDELKKDVLLCEAKLKELGDEPRTE